MKQRNQFVLGLALVVFFFVGLGQALEWIKTYHGSVTSTMTIAQDSVSTQYAGRVFSKALKHSKVDTSNYTNWVQLNGSHLNMRYRFKVDSSYKPAQDSLQIKLQLALQNTLNEGDSVNAKFYQEFTVSECSLSTSWQYDNFKVDLDSSDNAEGNLLRVWMIASDSVADSLSDSSRIGNVYDKDFEYWLEVWK
jgi:hypothetical protein